MPWSGFDLINAFNAWKNSEDAGRIFVVAADGTIAKHVVGLEWRHKVAAQAWRGGQVLLADRRFASTRTCSRCGLVKQQMGLAERTFRCDRCSLVMDRDCNAAANLAAWAEAASLAAALVPARQAGGRVTNAPGGEGADHRHGDGATGPGEGGTDAHAVLA